MTAIFMQKVVQIIIFLSGLGSLLLYIASIINELKENRKITQKENETKGSEKDKHKRIIKIALLSIGLFVFATLLHKLLLYIPKSDLTGEFGIIAIFIMFVELFHKYGSINLENDFGLILWLFSLLPYFIFMSLWLMIFLLKKLIMRN